MKQNRLVNSSTQDPQHAKLLPLESGKGKDVQVEVRKKRTYVACIQWRWSEREAGDAANRRRKAQRDAEEQAKRDAAEKAQREAETKVTREADAKRDDADGEGSTRTSWYKAKKDMNSKMQTLTHKRKRSGWRLKARQRQEATRKAEAETASLLKARKLAEENQERWSEEEERRRKAREICGLP